MGRKALHTQDQVFEAADRLAASSREVTPTTLREALGGGSLTTIYRHLEAGEATRRAAPAPGGAAAAVVVRPRSTACRPVAPATSSPRGRERRAVSSARRGPRLRARARLFRESSRTSRRSPGCGGSADRGCARRRARIRRVPASSRRSALCRAAATEPARGLDARRKPRGR